MLSAKEAIRILNRDVSQETLSFASPIFPYSKVVLVYNHPEYLPHFKTNGVCYVLVHAGFTLVDDHVLTLKLTSDKEKYGDYSEYSNNITRLIKRLRKSDDLSLFLVDEPCFHGEELYPLRFLPSVSNLF